MADQRQLRREFARAFAGEAPTILSRAPGRINLIGAHADYNGGFVMPAAVDLATVVLARPRRDRKVRIVSLALAERADGSLDRPPRSVRPSWARYPLGVARLLEEEGIILPGCDLLIGGDVPIGGGLSSSAALEVACALAYLHLARARLVRRELARLCRKAENEFTGVRCGIMDQFASLFGKAGHALLLDCRYLDYEAIPLPDAVRIVVCDSRVKRELSGMPKSPSAGPLFASALRAAADKYERSRRPPLRRSGLQGEGEAGRAHPRRVAPSPGDYNRRRAECEEGVERLRKYLPGIEALRDVPPAALRRFGPRLPPIIRKRCAHVVNELPRTLSAAKKLKKGDLAGFGRMMFASHASCRDLYEVSSPELDCLVAAARKVPGVYGARLTGAGFGGCTVNLVAEEAVEDFRSAVAGEYLRGFGKEPRITVCRPSDGASAETIH